MTKQTLSSPCSKCFVPRNAPLAMAICAVLGSGVIAPLYAVPGDAMDADGDFVVSWGSGSDSPSSNSFCIYAQRYEGSGYFAVGTVDLNLVVQDDTDPVTERIARQLEAIQVGNITLA